MECIPVDYVALIRNQRSDAGAKPDRHQPLSRIGPSAIGARWGAHQSERDRPEHHGFINPRLGLLGG